MNTLLSIIVPAYKIENYLGPCLESIIAQTYRPLEIIVVDDGSPDNSGKIADHYAEKYADLIRCIHIPNGGVTNARLAGVKASKGEWIGFVDGDDLIESDMYERLMKNAVENNADISHCGYQTIVNNGERIHYFYNSGLKLKQDNYTGKRDLLAGEQVEPGVWNKIYKNGLLKQMLEENLLDCSIKINEDLLMNYLLFDHANNSVYEDFCPYHYISRDDSVTRKKFYINKVTDPIKVRKWILDHCDNELKPLAWRKYLICCAEGYKAVFGKKEYVLEAKAIKSTIDANREQQKYLTTKERFKLKLIISMPFLYKGIYYIYDKFFSIHVYE